METLREYERCPKCGYEECRCCPECGSELYKEIGEENERIDRCSNLECGYITN